MGKYLSHIGKVGRKRCSTMTRKHIHIGPAWPYEIEVPRMGKYIPYIGRGGRKRCSTMTRKHIHKSNVYML